MIAKLKQNSQQQAQAIKKEIPEMKKEIPATVETDEDEFLEDDDETNSDAIDKVEKAVDPKEQARIQAILEEIEMLQNNGRFRAELLHQMQEINQALVVIAGALANLSKHDKA